MGYSTVRYAGRAFEANDGALEVWLLAVLRHLDDTPAAGPRLADLREHWHLHATAGFGFGIVPQLDDYLADAGLRDVVRAACRRALQELETWPDPVPVDTLSRGGPGGPDSRFVGPVPRAAFVDVGREFCDLIGA